MTRGQLLDMLEQTAAECRADVRASVRRNNHMNNLTEADLRQIDDNPLFFQRLADAVLVDFINQVALGQGINRGEKTEHIRT